PGVVCRSLVHGNGFALEIFKLCDFRRAFLDQKLKVSIEIALSKQHALGALLGDRRGSGEEIVGPSLQRRNEAGELRSIQNDLAFEALAELVGEVDVEALITAGQIRKRMRGKRAVDRCAKRRGVLGPCGRGGQECSASRKHKSDHGRPSNCTRQKPSHYSNHIMSSKLNAWARRRGRARFRLARWPIGCPTLFARYRFSSTTFATSEKLPTLSKCEP